MTPPAVQRALTRLAREIEECQACPRLRNYCARISQVKRRAFAEESYWGKPVPGFGDPGARLIVVGLAPAAHGANRTGRVFTGDRSGEWLYSALHRHGFASSPQSISRQDGLRLRDAYITCVARCAPPGNRPTPRELERCTRAFLSRELEQLKQARVYLLLGQIACDSLWRLSHPQPLRKPKFAHGAEAHINGKTWLMSYHPSQQNTFTGRLTPQMWDAVFKRARQLVELD